MAVPASTAAKDTPEVQAQLSMFSSHVRENFDSEYHKTLEGKMQIVIIVFSFIAYLTSLFMTCHHCSSVNFFNVISGFNTWIAISFFLLGSFHIYKRIHFIPWKLSLVGWTMIWTIFYTIGFFLLIMQLKDLPVAVMSLVGVCLHGFMLKFYYPDGREQFDALFKQQTNSSPNNQV